MKPLLNKLLLVSVVCIILGSCKKDETRATINTGAAPVLASTKTAVVLNQANSNDTAVVFSWNAVNYGFDAALNYSLQISKAGTKFASATTTEIGLNYADFKKGFKVTDLNRELNKILTPGVATPLEIRLKSEYGSLYSNVVAMTATAYRQLVVYNYPQAINVAGNFQGWAPPVAPQIVSLANDGKYEGFIDFNDPSPQFKFVKGNDWPFGDFGAGVAAGSILSPSGNNLTISTGAGNYLVKANTTALTWSSYKVTTWGVIGGAVPGTGWNSDVNMTYDATSKAWKITMDLLGGTGNEIKFRANDDWAVNLGDTGNDGKPELDGANIPIPAAGNYSITLDISAGGNWVYTLKKN